MNRPITVLITLFVLALPLSASAQILNAIRSETASSPASGGGHSSGRSGHHYHDDDDDEDSFFGELIGSLLGEMFSAAWENSEVDFEYDNQSPPPPSSTFMFAHYPYADGLDGYRFDNTLDVRPENRGQSLWFEYGNDFDHMSRYSMKFLWEQRDGWNVDAEWSFFEEELLGGGHDQLHVGDVNILVPLMQAETLTTYAGAGVNWMTSQGQDEIDWNTTLRFNSFPGRPFIVSGEFDYGQLGRAHLVHTALSAGVIWKHAEFFAGYDYRKIGNSELHGPMIGGRVWW